MRSSALILLSKGLDPSRIENWRPIALLNVDRKILAKVVFNRLFAVSEMLLSPFQHCTVKGRSAFSAVLGVREALERCRADRLVKYLLALAQSKAFDCVNHKYLWALLERYGLPVRVVNWIQVIYRGAESFPLVNGWVGPSFSVDSGVRQGCPLSPLLYVFAIDPFIRRVSGEAMRGVHLAPEKPLRVVAYADDVTIIVSDTSEAELVAREIQHYSEASASVVNHEKSKVFWMGEEGEHFPLPDTFPQACEVIKILGIKFGPGDCALRNWEERLGVAAAKVECWKRWRMSLRERVYVIKTYIVPTCLYVSYVYALPRPLWAKVLSTFFQMLWGNRMNIVKRSVTYRLRGEGGLGMVNPVSFYLTAFLSLHLKSLMLETPPQWVEGFRSWVHPFINNWLSGGAVKSFRVSHGYLPTYVYTSLNVTRIWRLEAGTVKISSRRELERKVLQSHFWVPLLLKDCPDSVCSDGIKLINDRRIPPKVWDIVWFSFHGRLYVRGNLKCRDVNDRGCPREECPGVVETMDHFLLQCPFNVDVYKRVSSVLGIPCLSRLSYSEWVYGIHTGWRNFDLTTLFIVSAVVRYFTWHARCQLGIHQKRLPVEVVVGDILHMVWKIRGIEERRMEAVKHVLLWRGLKPP